MSPNMKLFVATVIALILFYTLAVNKAFGQEGPLPKTYKMCLVGPVGDTQEKGCWAGDKHIPFKVWLKNTDPKAVYVKTLVPVGGGIAKVYYEGAK